MFINTPLALAAAVSAVAAAPLDAPEAVDSLLGGVFHIPLTYRVPPGVSMEQLAESGNQRLVNLNSKTKKKGQGTNMVSNPSELKNNGIAYFAPMKFGNGHDENLELIIDTGSSVTFCVKCDDLKASGGTATGESMALSYGSGDVKAKAFQVDATFSTYTAKALKVGQTTTVSSVLKDVDGLIGFGPRALTYNTIVGKDDEDYPTYMNLLTQQKVIQKEVLGVSFTAATKAYDVELGGTLTIGGVEPKLFTGSLSYFDNFDQGVYSSYWSVGVDKIKLGNQDLAGNQKLGCVVDTGSTFIYLPTSVLNAFAKATGGSINKQNFLIFNTMPTAVFTLVIGGVDHTLRPEQYTLSKDMQKEFGLGQSNVYSHFTAYPDPPAKNPYDEITCILGQRFLEVFYAVFDASKTNRRIGFAINKPK